MPLSAKVSFDANDTPGNGTGLSYDLEYPPIPQAPPQTEDIPAWEDRAEKNEREAEKKAEEKDPTADDNVYITNDDYNTEKDKLLEEEEHGGIFWGWVIQARLNKLEENRKWSQKHELVSGLGNIGGEINDSDVKNIINQVLDDENIDGINLDLSGTEVINVSNIYESVDLYNQEVGSYKNDNNVIEAFQSLGLSLVTGGIGSKADFGSIYQVVDTVNQVMKNEDTTNGEDSLQYAELVAPGEYNKYDITYTQIYGSAFAMEHEVTIMVQTKENGEVKKPYHIYAYDRTKDIPAPNSNNPLDSTQLSPLNWILDFNEYGKAQ